LAGIIPRFLVTVLTLFVLFALAGFQVTGATAATRLLGRLGSALIEVDRWLPAHREELELRARERPQGFIQPGDIPVVTTLPSSQILDAPDQLQDRLVTAMGSSLYENGTDALQGSSGPVKLSEEEPVRLATNLLSKDAHRKWTAALIVGTILLAGLCLDFLRAGRTPLPALLLGATLASIGAGGGLLMATAAGTVLDSGVDKEVMRIARDGAWLGLRDSLAVAVACFGLLLISRTAGWERGGYLPNAEWRHERSQVDYRSY
jgi:hypothetical protein